jgi:hypothetical protein
MASPAQMDRNKRKSSKSQGSPGQRNRNNSSNKNTSSNKRISGGGGGGSNKDNNKERQQILKDLDKAQKNLDRKESKTSTTTGTTLPGSSTTNTKEFLDDLKEAYKAGLFSSGTKGKAFMDKYNLKPGELGRLRSSIDMGLGSRIGDGGNVLTDLVGDLRQEGILTTASRSPEFLQQRAGDIFEPGMTKYDREPITGFMGVSPVLNLGLKGFDFLAGGSSQGMRGAFYGRNVLGLEGEELDNFAASVANDRDFYNQMMKTPEMQNYELNEFRAEANKNAMARMRGGDPDPISGSQGGEGGEGGEGDDGTTDPGTDPSYTPPPQNYFTFFDPDIGKYRSGTYDEYLRYVTAKDGGIIQLENGGTPPNAPGGVLPQGRKEQLEDLFEARREIQNLDTPTDSERKGSNMIMEEIDDRAKDISDISKEGIMMAMRDQPAKDLFAANNPDIGPALREDLGFFGRLGDSGLSLFMEALRKSDITTGSANQFIDKAIDNFISAGIIPQYTTYDQLTDPFKDLVTREAAMIAKSENERQEGVIPYVGSSSNKGVIPYMGSPISDRRPVNPETNDRIDDMMRDQFMNQLYDQALDYQNQKEQDGDTIIRDPRTNEITGFNVADGGIISLKDGGMNDMMAADSLMFKDPSDEGEWEYNV